MPSSHSRSEIESALSSKSKKMGSSPAHAKTKPQSNRVSPRKQQVLGGNLTGVSAQRNSKVGIWFSGINIVYAIGLVVIAIILLAFFWPQANERSVREVEASQQIKESESIYRESRIDEPQSLAPTSENFGKLDDLTRATAFREQEALESKVSELLDVAARHRTRGEYTEPAGKNAVTAYNQILALDPRNVTASEGLNYIKGRFLNAGYAALQQGTVAEAKSSLEKISRIDQQSEQYLELQIAIQDWQKQDQINVLLRQASAALEKNNLVLPGQGNALFYFRQALEIDAENEAANQGIGQITGHYADLANRAYVDGEFEAAKGYLATISVIDPTHKAIESINSLISNSRSSRTPKSNSSRSSRKPSNSPATNTMPAPRPETVVNKPVSQQRTPTVQANEQAEIDRQYLANGLRAYYQGEYDKAIGLLQPLADKGISRAQFRIAYMHYLGRGVERDRKEADRIIRAALPAIQNFAQEGRSWAQSDLGSLYEDGLVLPRDYREAIYWYRNAAEKGYPGAQTNLGIMYARGRGVAQSRKTAIQWFQRAAKQGDIAAKRNLQSYGIE